MKKKVGVADNLTLLPLSNVHAMCVIVSEAPQNTPIVVYLRG